MKTRNTASAPKHYVQNDALRSEIVLSLRDGALTDEALTMLLLMIDRIQLKFHYENLDDKCDCKSAATEVILKKWDRCKPKEYPNVFSFFTQMIKHGLYAGWNELTKKRAEFSTSNIFANDI